MKDLNIDQYKEEMLQDLAELVSYPSVYSEDAAPFGQANIDCLNAALKIAEGYGFKTVNLDNYCGYVEMGQGEEIIGILAHLDVVPVSDTWATNPFELTEKDGKYYGRGTSDDKGAGIASLTAMRMLQEKASSFNKRVRLIWGCNEESGSKGVKYYLSKEGAVDCGFTPDGNFPLVYGEKGMVGGAFVGTSAKILDIKGGTVSNAVAANCTVTLADGCVCENCLAKFFNENNITYTFENNVLTVTGVAAHASMPELGVNAISYAMEGLYQAGIDDDLVTAYHNLIGLDYNGNNASVGFEDEYGKLTFNIGLAFKKDDKLCFTIDIRFPVTYKSETVINALNENGQGYIKAFGGAEPLFFPLDHPMIKALYSAYVEATGDSESKPLCIGGGTYAKAMPNIVAYGCEDDKYNYHIHDDNEFVTWESLEMQVACYYQAILNLLEI